MDKICSKFRLKIVDSKTSVKVGDVICFKSVPGAEYEITHLENGSFHGRRLPKDKYKSRVYLFSSNYYRQYIKDGTIIKHTRNGEDRLKVQVENSY